MRGQTAILRLSEEKVDEGGMLQEVFQSPE